jgi:hypothetical protein
MTVQLSKKQIEALKVELAQYGLNVTQARIKPPVDWISERQAAIRGATFKAQAAFWKTTQNNLLKLRRKISPEYEAFITRSV